MENGERLTRLEERLAHLQRHVTEQDKAMLALGDELARLRRELMLLRAHGAPAPEPGGDTSEPKPPHY